MTRSNQTWLAAHLYYAEPWEEFLIQGVKPFVETVFAHKWADQFFFIRYWEQGPHIRLRFKGEAHTLEHEVKPALEAFFGHYFENKPSQRSEPNSSAQRWFANHSIQYMLPYEPEVERYGGLKGILIAEKQFELSSQAVLALIDERESWNYERALGAAIQLHLGFASALGMDLADTKRFYAQFFKSWFPSAYRFQPNLSEEELEKRRSVTLKAFAENFASQRTPLVSYHLILWEAFADAAVFEQDWLNQWLDGMVGIARELRQAQQESALVSPIRSQSNRKIKTPGGVEALWPILSSYVHMTNNRLGILNRDESYLGYLTMKSLEART